VEKHIEILTDTRNMSKGASNNDSFKKAEKMGGGCKTRLPRLPSTVNMLYTGKNRKNQDEPFDEPDEADNPSNNKEKHTHRPQ